MMLWSAHIHARGLEDVVHHALVGLRDIVEGLVDAGRILHASDAACEDVRLLVEARLVRSG